MHTDRGQQLRKRGRRRTVFTVITMAAGLHIQESMFLDGASRATAEKYNCPQCKQLLRNAVQPSCGHWLCEECARGLFTTSSPPTCPRPDCREELEGEDGVEYFPDRFVRKEILNLKVKCLGHDNGCGWTGKLKDYEDHFKECLFVTKECEFCGHAFPILELTSHVATCPKAGKQCPLMGLGCTAGRMPAPQLQKHCTELIAEHFHWLSAAVKDLQAQADKGQPHLRDIPEEDEGGDYQSSTNRHRGERPGDYDSGYGSFHGKTSHRPIDMVERDGGGSRPRTKERPMKLDLLKTEVVDPFSGLSGMGVAGKEQILRELLPQLRSRDDEVSALKASVTKLEKQLRAKNAELEDRDFRLSLIENSSFDGTMVWKIPQFEQRMADAKSGKYTSIFSLPFYTGRYGYKMCLRLYILGDGIGKNTHMSLFFVIMRNEFDSILQWPFTHRVTFKLINQSGGRDIVETFQPDPASSSFRKPKSDMNIASGCPKFVSHQDLQKGFIVEDTIYIKCSVDTSSIRVI